MNVREMALTPNARIDPMVHRVLYDDDEDNIWSYCGKPFYLHSRSHGIPFKITAVRVVLPATCLWCISKENP